MRCTAMPTECLAVSRLLKENDCVAFPNGTQEWWANAVFSVKPWRWAEPDSSPPEINIDPEAKAQFGTHRDLHTLADALAGADVFVGLSVANIVSQDMVRSMASRPLVFAMANPDPEIAYDEARAARPDAIIATGRSDHPNQVNNVLGFPFVFRGALDVRARRITEEMKVAATRALAALAKEDVPDEVLRAYGAETMTFGPNYLIPTPFDPRVLLWVAPAVAQAAVDSGAARRPITDLDAYRDRLHRLVERARGLMQPLINQVRRGPKQRIVLPDGPNPSVLRAAHSLVQQGICTPVLLGPTDKIVARAATAKIDLTGIEIEDCDRDGALFQELSTKFWQLRRRKGVTYAAARSALRKRVYYGAMMVRLGLADGLVAGHGRPYRDTLSPALQALGLAEGAALVSGSYAMIFKDRRIFLGDCTVNVDPDAETLAEIALNTARIAETFQQTPRVAMLSWSDFGEGRKDAEVIKVRRAIEIVRQRRPDLEIDGEMQADTAVRWDKMSQLFPFTTLTGPPNVLVFPNLTAGNIAYKLLASLTDAEVVGPLLTGLNGSVSVIPAGATVNEIVNIATYTANAALDKARGRG